MENLKNISDTLGKRTEYRRMREELDALIDACNDAVKKLMETEGVDVLTAGPYKVVWREVTSTVLDSKKLKAAAPDIWTLYSYERTTKPFTVKV